MYLRGSRPGSRIAVSVPHVMPNVCHGFWPPGGPPPRKLQAHVISIADE